MKTENQKTPLKSDSQSVVETPTKPLGVETSRGRRRAVGSVPRFTGVAILCSFLTFIVGVGSVDSSTTFTPSEQMEDDASTLSKVRHRVRPVIECVAEIEAGRLVAVFGYKNKKDLIVEIPVGKSNKFTPQPIDRGQPTSFLPGRQRRVFTVPFDGHKLVWHLAGRTATASSATKRCAGDGSLMPPDRGEITQTFTDLIPTAPTQEEVDAPADDLDTTFPPGGEPVPPGPELLVDSHFWDGPIPEGTPLPGISEPETQETLALELAAAAPEGTWREAGVTGAPNTSDVAIHAALLRTSARDAEILFFAGDGHDKEGSQRGDIDHTGVFRIINAATNQFEVKKIESPPSDLFCAGHAQLEDGRLLVAGGTAAYEGGGGVHDPHFKANRDSFIFDPKLNAWSARIQLNFEPGQHFEVGTKGGGRWYPTLITLGNGAVTAFWGHPFGVTCLPNESDADCQRRREMNDDSRHTNNTPEFFTPGIPTWRILGRETDVPTSIDLGYPRVHLLPNGRLFRATPIKQVNVEINPLLESLVDRNELSQVVSDAPSDEFPTDYSYPSVLLPLTPANRYQARVLLAGRNQPLLVTLGRDIGAPREGWRPTSNRARLRIHDNATLLPTGEVFVSGGKSGRSFAQTRVLEGEIYNPFNDTWRVVAPARVPREYHSVALLMPDGRVWHAGTSVEGGRGATNQERRIELYEPSYYSLTRPVIRAMTGPADPLYGGAPLMHLRDTRFAVEVDHFRPIAKFVLIRAGSVTHAFNSDQRYIELEAQLVETTQRFNPDGFTFKFAVVPPPSSTIVPPGMYLLFALDDRGIPSVGRFVRVDRRFVAELPVEAEDFTSKTAFGIGVPVPADGTVSLNARTVPFELFPQLEYGGIDFGPETGTVKKFSVFGRGEGDPLRGRGNGAIIVHLDQPGGAVIARVALQGGPFEHIVDIITPVSGVHNVHISYVVSLLGGLPGGPTTARASVDSFKFKP